MSLAASVFTALAAVTPTPAPTPSGPPAELVTPGFGGFAVVALLVAAVVLLVWDMNRRIRRARYREEVAADLDAEQAAGDAERRGAAAAGDAGPEAGTGPDAATGPDADGGSDAGRDPRREE